MTTKLIFYTSTADPNKVLKHDVQLALTVTPDNIKNDLFSHQTPLTWKALTFPANASTTNPVIWQQTSAWAVGEKSEESIATQVGQDAILKEIAGNPVWDIKTLESKKLTATNNASKAYIFTLGVTDKPEEGTFEGLVRFPEIPHGKHVIIDPCTLLQAYSVKGYQVGTPLSKTDAENFIFSKAKKADPVDITKLANGTTYLLYTNVEGNLVLEQQ